MKKRLAAAIAALWLTFAMPAQAMGVAGLPSVLPGLENAPPFTADVMITSASMPTPTRFRISYMPQRVRLESRGSEGMTAIIRLDEGSAYMFQGDRSWLRLSLASLGALGLASGAQHSVTKLANQTVDGRACEVYQTTSGDGTVSTNYVSGGLPFKSIVRTPTGGDTVLRYLNVSRGGVNASLFSLPSDAEVIDMANLLNGLKGRKGGDYTFEEP
ncbi:hypothetical protein D3C87_824700 [compost metagenome]